MEDDNDADAFDTTNRKNRPDESSSMHGVAHGLDRQTSQAYGSAMLYPTSQRKPANPSPLGLCGFALTTFLLSLINMGTAGLTESNIVIAAAFAYGGLCQLLAGMWEMALGNTLAATALSSYSAFWMGVAIILTPGGFEIMQTLGPTAFSLSFSLYLFGWFIFTIVILLVTIRSTLAFFSLFFFLDLAFLMLALAYYYCSPTGGPQNGLLKAGGLFGLLAAFLAWYNALAGLVDSSNSFFSVPLVPFPWSEEARKARKAKKEDCAA